MSPATEPVELTPALLRAMPLPEPQEGGDKDGRGRILVIGGSRQVPGAAVLAATSALRAGAGKLQIATCRGLASHIGIAIPESLVLAVEETASGGLAAEDCGDLMDYAARADAVLLGPGMMDQEAVAALTARLLAEAPDPALVLDAAALTGVASQREALLRRQGRVVLTPHAGEMASLLEMDKDEVQARPVETARRAASEFGAVVALKGATTHIAAPDGRVWINRHGSVGLATSGSGDTLAGIVAGLLARGAAPEVGLLWAVHVHAEAGRRLSERLGKVGFLAREIPGEVPSILAALSS